MSYGSIVEGKDVDFSRFKWANSDINRFKSEFDKVKSFLGKDINQENFQLLIDSFYFLIDRIPLSLLSINNSFLVRGRPNYNGEVFKEESDISYNTKNQEKIKLGRFNRPFDCMFYAAVPSNPQSRMTATVLLECCKEIEDESNITREQFFTFGKWFLKEPIRVLNLCFHEKCLQTNAFLNGSVDFSQKELREKMPLKLVEFIEGYWAFLSNLSCNKYSTDQQYFITAAFIATMKEYYGDEFNGIIYPSSMTGMEGLDIVLTPQAVGKYLDLKQAFMYKLARTPNNPKGFNGYQCSNIADVVDHRFNITTLF